MVFRYLRCSKCTTPFCVASDGTLNELSIDETSPRIVVSPAKEDVILHRKRTQWSYFSDQRRVKSSFLSEAFHVG